MTLPFIEKGACQRVVPKHPHKPGSHALGVRTLNRQHWRLADSLRREREQARRTAVEGTAGGTAGLWWAGGTAGGQCRCGRPHRRRNREAEGVFTGLMPADHPARGEKLAVTVDPEISEE